MPTRNTTLAETIWFFDHVNVELLAKIIQIKLER